jgi:hypothetical protein
MPRIWGRIPQNSAAIKAEFEELPSGVILLQVKAFSVPSELPTVEEFADQDRKPDLLHLRNRLPDIGYSLRRSGRFLQ